MLRSAPMAVLSSPVSKPLWPRCAVAGILGTASAAGAMAPASVATATGSFIKGLPGIGTVIGALTMPVASAGATWVIGKVFIQHFASGGTLLDFNPPDYREFIKVQKAKVAARTRALPPP